MYNSLRIMAFPPNSQLRLSPMCLCYKCTCDMDANQAGDRSLRAKSEQRTRGTFTLSPSARRFHPKPLTSGPENKGRDLCKAPISRSQKRDVDLVRAVTYIELYLDDSGGGGRERIEPIESGAFHA